MRKITRWVREKFMPAYAKAATDREIERLEIKVKDLETTIDALENYIDGLQWMATTVGRTRAPVKIELPSPSLNVTCDNKANTESEVIE